MINDGLVPTLKLEQTQNQLIVIITLSE